MMMDQDMDDLFPPPPPTGVELTGAGRDGEGDSDSSLDVDQELSNKDGRIIRRGKRGVKLDGSGAGVNGLSTSVPVTCYMSAAAKNSRKSRNAFTHSRGEPKKGGAGGKGVWGKLGSELEESSLCTDKNDPNYDSDSQGDYTLEEVSIILTKDQLLKVVEPMIREYFEHGKTDEVEELLSGLNIGPNSQEIAKLAVCIALEKHNPQREMISRLISDLYGKILTSDEIAKAFDELLENIDDLVLDTPEAPILIGQFIARCIADDCLPPKFITGYKGKVKNDRVKEALEKAEVLLTMNHGLAHLDNIWGVGGGNRPVRSLTNKIIDLVKEYLHSGDKEEARRCLVELEVPHFHHELVYQSCEIVIEETTERARDQVVELLKYFTESNVVTMDQFEKGIRRLFKDISDIFLDVPAAYVMLDLLMDKLKQEGVASQALVAEMPKSSRGGRCRKRFVSEGDGGRLKAEYDEDGEQIKAA